MRRLNLFDHLRRVHHKVFVLNGSHDRFHDSAVFPAVADAIPDGVFVRVPVGEDKRERLCGAATGVFASTDPQAGLPPALAEFVVPPESARVSSTG